MIKTGKRLRLKESHDIMRPRKRGKEVGGTVSLADKTYSLRNDLLFHMVFSKNEKARKGLIAAMLDIPVTDIVKAEVTNPMQYSECINSKLTVLDLKVHLNESRYILIEMQVRRFDEWTNRSIVYACRQITEQVIEGFNYGNLQQVIQISIMDHPLFKEHKRFFTKYELVDRENFSYSDKLKFIVMDLTSIELATPEDKTQGLLNWAKAFKADSWEEVQCIDDANVKEAAKTMEMIVKNPSEREILDARINAINDQITAEASAEKRGRLGILFDLVDEGLLSIQDASQKAGVSVKEFEKARLLQ